MKKNILKSQIKWVVLLVTICSGCDVLNVQPKEQVVAETVAITDKSTAQIVLNGVYSALGNSDYYGTSYQVIGYFTKDNIAFTGSQSQFSEFLNNGVKPDNGTISNAWNGIYRTINRANHVIAKVPPVISTSAPDQISALNQILGEAYFLRALAYFDLARAWGGVPIVTKPTLTISDNVGTPRSTLSDTYAQVLSDLNKAEVLLQTITGTRFTATWKTVQALKARYYLYNKDYANAEAFATTIITDASYKLTPPFNSWFANNVRGTNESIFEIFYNGTTEVNGHRNSWQPQANGGTRQWAPSSAIYSLLTSNVTTGLGVGRSALVGGTSSIPFGNLYYRQPASDPSYILRIAELYLIRAEARAQLNPTNLTSAISDLNAVRTRAGLANTTATTQSDVLLAIENERRAEFAFEAHRWFDLVRTGRAKTVLGFTDDYKLLLPIPIDQTRTDPAVVQNPGY
jgi:starch-binding outer membrane protein, SusD/RagB family